MKTRMRCAIAAVASVFTAAAVAGCGEDGEPGGDSFSVGLLLPSFGISRFEQSDRPLSAGDAAEPGPVALVVGDRQAAASAEGNGPPAPVAHAGVDGWASGPASTSNSRFNGAAPIRRRRSRSAFSEGSGTLPASPATSLPHTSRAPKCSNRPRARTKYTRLGREDSVTAAPAFRSPPGPRRSVPAARPALTRLYGRARTHRRFRP
jgi:hypothetical protein